MAAILECYRWQEFWLACHKPDTMLHVRIPQRRRNLRSHVEIVITHSQSGIVFVPKNLPLYDTLDHQKYARHCQKYFIKS